MQVEKFRNSDIIMQDHLQYEWIDLDQIDKYPLMPESMKEILKKGQFPVHKINIDK